MKKHSTYLSALFLSCLFIFTACNQGQKQEAVVENKKDIYIQLYSVRDDIKADYTGTIAAVAEMGYTGVEAAGYNDGKFYDMSPADFKKSIEDAGMTVLHMQEDPLQTQLLIPIGKKHGHGGIPQFRLIKRLA